LLYYQFLLQITVALLQVVQLLQLAVATPS